MIVVKLYGQGPPNPACCDPVIDFQVSAIKQTHSGGHKVMEAMICNKPNQICKIYNALWEIPPPLEHLTFDVPRLLLFFLIVMYLSIIAMI